MIPGSHAYGIAGGYFQRRGKGLLSSSDHRARGVQRAQHPGERRQPRPRARATDTKDGQRGVTRRRDSQERFRERYRTPLVDAALISQRAAIGANVGANGYTTVSQADSRSE